MGTNITTAFITCPVNEKETLGIKLPFLVMIIKNVLIAIHAVKKVFHLRSAGARRQKCAQTLPSIQLPVDHSCQALHLHHAHEARRRYSIITMQDGTRSSSTCPTSPAEPTARTTSRPWEWPSTPTVESAESTFRIVYTASRSCLPNSNCSCQFRSSNESVAEVSEIDYIHIYNSNLFFF